MTKKRVVNDQDFFKRLRECILSLCTQELKDADLLELFDICGVDLSDEQLVDFGEMPYILERLQRELSAQFNTRKQLILKALYAYVDNSKILSDINCFSIFGTTSFEHVWEEVCTEIMDDQLKIPVGALNLPTPLSAQFIPRAAGKLIELIDKPTWNGYIPDGSIFVKPASLTLKPDLIIRLSERLCREFKPPYAMIEDRYILAAVTAPCRHHLII